MDEPTKKDTPIPPMSEEEFDRVMGEALKKKPSPEDLAPPKLGRGRPKQ